jgi:WD40 repeat protein
MVTALAWSPTRPILAVAGNSGLVQLWRVDGAPRRARSLTGLTAVPGVPEAVQALTFSPDGRLLAASDNSRTGTPVNTIGDHFAALAIWRASNGELVVPKGLGTGSGVAGALAFSRDGKLLAASRPDSSVVVLDPTTGQVRRTLRPLGADETVSLAFASGGTLATGTRGGIVQLWNPVSGAQTGDPVAVAAGPVTSIAFDPTGPRFATTGQDGTVKLWASSTLQQEGTALNTDQGADVTAAFEPGGKDLLVVDDHGRGFSWPTSLAAWERRACTVAGRNLTRAEWAKYLPGQPYTRVCP